jgi:protein-S-isoprenylcysteine O-methyltransferase Ste14
VRHPQALSLCVLVVGLVLLSGSLPILVTAPLWIAFWVFYTYLEESWELLPTFGEAYRRYRTSTPRLLPRVVPDRFRRSL